MDPKTTPAAEPTLAEVMAAVTAIGGQLSTLTERIDSIEAAGDPLSAEELADLEAMTDEQLAAQGLTRAEIEAAVAATTAPDAGADGAADAAAAAKGGEAAAATTTALKSLQRRIIQLEKRGEDEAAQAEEAETLMAFETLEKKQNALIALNTQLTVRNQALESQLRRSGRAAAPSTETVRLFSAKDADGAGKFETMVTHFMEEGNKAGKGISRTEAIRLSILKDPAAYQEWEQETRERLAQR